jgi:drug/metabolite transporter (DMT)-like permease
MSETRPSTAPAVPGNRMQSIDWLMLVALSMLWGGSFLFIGLAVHDLPPFTIVAIRVTVAAIILCAVVRITGHRLPDDWLSWRDFFILGLLGNTIPFSLISFGQGFIPSGLAAILNATTPLFTVLLLNLLMREPVGAGRAVGLLFGLAGVAVLMGPKAFSGAHAGLIGALAVLLGSLSYGAGGVWSKRFRDRPAVVTAAASLACAALQTVPLALLFDHPWTLRPELTAVAAVLALATFSTALAYLLFYRIISRAGPANATQVTFLVPVSAILLGTLFLDERLPWTAFAGMAIIFAGLAAIDGRLWSWIQRRRTVSG